jgi:hypothetical protein
MLTDSPLRCNNYLSFFSYFLSASHDAASQHDILASTVRQGNQRRM